MFIIGFVVVVLFAWVAAEAHVHNGPFYDEPNSNLTQIWHSYEFNTGVGNREELQIVKVELNNNSILPKNVYKWANLQVQGETILIGLGVNFLSLTTYRGNNNDSFTYKEEIQDPTKDFSVFQKWDANTQSIESFVVLASGTTDTSELKWYKIHNRQLKFLCDWKFHRIISHVDVIKFNHEPKLLIVSQQREAERNSSIDVYSFNLIPQLDVWLFEKIAYQDFPSSVTAFSDNANNFIIASFPQSETVNIWKYSNLCLQSSEKHYTLHQKIQAKGLVTLKSFRVGLKWHVAITAENSSIYQMNENLVFQALNLNSDLGPQQQVHIVPIDTYREDAIALFASQVGMSALLWTETNKVEFIKDFTRLMCENDTNCLVKFNSEVLLSDATTFLFNGYQNVIIPTESGTALILKLSIHLRPLHDKVFIKLKELRNLKSALEEDYKMQLKEVENLRKINDDINTDSPAGNSTETPENDYDDDSDETGVKSDVEVDSDGHIEILSLRKNWSDFSNVLNEIRARIESLKSEFVNLNDSLSVKDPSNQGNSAKSQFLPGNISNGITFHGRVVINNLNATVANGHNVDHLLKDSYRKDKKGKIGGKKSLSRVQTDNLAFESINDVLACDIVHSDDPWEGGNGNVIVGDILWENKLNILNDFVLQKEKAPEGSFRNRENLFNMPKHQFENVHFEELEITTDTTVQSSINSRPLILPVHTPPLSVHSLDMVNQARVEQVYVQGDLNVSTLNGKDFEDIMEQVIYTVNTPGGRKYNFARIEGALSVKSLEVDYVNSSPLHPESSEREKSDETDAARSRPSFKSSSGSGPRKNIFVFQNLDVRGIVETTRINNVGWNVLNDTVRKDGSPVVGGIKTFTKPLSVAEANVRTLNDESVENILTKDSDQTIRFPQIFSSVSFENVSLDGTWDGIDVNKLNESILRGSNSHDTSVVFSEASKILTDRLNVTNSVNDASLTDLENGGGEEERGDDPSSSSVTRTDIGKLKFVKASVVIVNGSLVTNDNINDVNLTRLDESRVSISERQHVKQDVFLDRLNIDGNVEVLGLRGDDGSSEGADNDSLADFFDGHVYKIKKLLVRGGVTTSQGVNGYHLSSLRENAISVTEPQVVAGSLEFADVVHFKNLNVTDSVDGINLKKLERDVTLKHSHVFMSGPKDFATLTILKDMKAKYLNGHLVQDTVTFAGDQAMKGPVRVTGDVHIRGNVTTNGRLNDIVIPQLTRRYSTHYDSYILGKDLILNADSVLVNNMVVGGAIQGRFLDQVVRNAIPKDGEDVRVTGTKLFKHQVKFNENLDVSDTLNGINVTRLLDDIVYVNRPAQLSGTLTVKEAILTVLEAQGDFNSKLVNGFDTNEWLEDAVRLDLPESISGRVKFADPHVAEDVVVDFINGHLSSAMIPLKSKQFVPVIAFAHRINVTSDLKVEGLVNGFNLMREYDNTILLYDSTTVESQIAFDGDFVINGDLTVDSISGKPVQDLVTLDTVQTIRNRLEVDGTVRVRGDVLDLKSINDVNLENWKERSVLLNREQEIKGLWKSRGVVKATHIGGDARLDSMSLPDVSKDIVRSLAAMERRRNETEMEYLAQCHRLENLSRELTKLPYLLHHFEVACIVDSQSIVESVIPLKIAGDDYLIVTKLHECLSGMYKWNVENSTYDYLRDINVGPVAHWLTSYRNNLTYLITSSLADSGAECEESLRPGNIWVFEGSSDKYIHLFTGRGFVDITHDSDTSEHFFTLDENGYIVRWSITDEGGVVDKFLGNVGAGNYRFVDFKLVGGLAVSNGRETKQIKFEDEKTVVSSFLTPYGHIVPLPTEEKVRAALVLRDKIVIYDDIKEEKRLSVLNVHRPGSVLWFNYGPGKQAFLIVSSQHKFVDVYEYKSVSGFAKKMSFQLFSTRLQSVSLPTRDRRQPSKFIVVIQKSKVIFLEADMLGDYYQEESEPMC